MKKLHCILLVIGTLMVTTSATVIACTGIRLIAEDGSVVFGRLGDFTPPSRFIRAAVYTQSLFPVKTGREAVLKAFHILNQFDIPRGAAVGMHEGKPEGDITQATIEADLKGLKYYSHNYQSRRIKMIDLTRVNFDGGKIVQIDLPSEETIHDLTPRK